jgi:hypothetical protein
MERATLLCRVRTTPRATNIHAHFALAAQRQVLAWRADEVKRLAECCGAIALDYGELDAGVPSGVSLAGVVKKS